MSTVARALSWEGALVVALWALAPAPADLWHFISSPQQFVDRFGADQAAILVCSSALCVLGALLVLAVAFAAIGDTVAAGVRLQIPITWVRRLAAAMLGLAVLPAAAACGPAGDAAPSTSTEQVTSAPPSALEQFDWPAAGEVYLPPVTEIPAEPAEPGQSPEPTADPEPPAVPAQASGSEQVYTVRGGDCLWTIAAAHLPPSATLAQIAEAADALWHANAANIGDNPDLIAPGQILAVPALNS